jgi:hypothetical protein
VARRIACVVEGHGDVEAVPIIVRRIAEQLVPPVVVQVSTPVRTPKSRLIKPVELERAVELAARRGGGGVLVVLDSDDDCPAQLGPALLARAASVRNGLPVGVVLAKCEFEAWFIAAAQSLGGVLGLPVGLQAPAYPEGIRGAKEWLTDRMLGSRSYSPTVDQAVLARSFDMVDALRADSFGKFCRETKRLLEQLSDV